MTRPVMLAGAALCIFVVVALVMLAVMPAPLKESDYLIVGSVATIVALLVLFLVTVFTSKSRDVFFKRRKK
jgi:hypothetical protein